MRHRLRAACTDSPLIHDFRTWYVDFGLVALEIHIFKFRRILHREARWRGEIAEGVVTGGVTPRLCSRPAVLTPGWASDESKCSVAM